MSSKPTGLNFNLLSRNSPATFPFSVEKQTKKVTTLSSPWPPLVLLFTSNGLYWVKPIFWAFHFFSTSQFIPNAIFSFFSEEMNWRGVVRLLTMMTTFKQYLSYRYHRCKQTLLITETVLNRLFWTRKQIQEKKFKINKFEYNIIMNYLPTLLELCWEILSLMQSLKKFFLHINGGSFLS